MAILSRVLHPEKSNDKPSLKHTSSSTGTLSPVESHSSPYTLSLSIALESPPVILYGQPQNSSGSIISGLFKLDIRNGKSLKNLDLVLVSSHSSTASLAHNDEIELERVSLVLVQTVKYTKPFVIPSSSVSGCKDCCTKKNELARWDVLSSRSTFSVGTHVYPFSHLLPGSLPASSKLGSTYSNSFIKYDLIATAKRLSSSKEVKVVLPLNIARLILRGPERNSLRVFPPTEATASCILPNVIHPKSTFPLQLRIDNIVNADKKRRWKMRKLVWRIEEHTKVKATTCSKHEPKLRLVEKSQRKTEVSNDLKSKVAAGNAHNSNSGQGPNKTSGYHHSTIQTSMFLSTCPSSQINNLLEENNNIEGINGAPVYSEDDALENQDTNVSSSSYGHENLINDFLSPVSSAANDIHNPGLLTNNMSDSRRTNLPENNNIAQQPQIDESESLYLDEIRTIAHGEIKGGWKSDFNGRGSIELAADIDVLNFSTGLNKHTTKRSSDDAKLDEVQEGLRNAANVSCDIDDPTLGIYVNHKLIAEVIVVEEIVSQSSEKKGMTIPSSLNQVTSLSMTNKSKPDSSESHKKQKQGQNQPGLVTGAARVLRMQFKVTITERSGLGIAWDDEVPPTYQDVREFSPPTYAETSASTTPVSWPVSRSTTPGIRDVTVGTSSLAQLALSPRLTSNSMTIDGIIGPDEQIQKLTI